MVGKLGRMAWRSGQVAAAIAVVLVPFAYAVTDLLFAVVMASGCGLAVGVGLSLRIGERGSRSAGVLIGTVAGIVAVLLVEFIPGNAVVWIVPPLLALAVGLVDGLGASRLRGYAQASRESLIMGGLITVGLLPALQVFALSCVVSVPLTALIAGALPANPEARRFSRPPALLALASLGAVMVATVAFAAELAGLGSVTLTASLAPAAWRVVQALVVIPAVVFLVARAGAIWVQPRLQVYRQLTEYLRVMWIPIGGFALGYVAIIVVFAGFSGMLARLSPGAFSGAEDVGIGEWIAFAFFRAVAQDYPGIVPVSAAAWLLVGVQVILAIGWALVVFAAVMSSIQPRLDRIARRTFHSTGE